jgi:hypothetical protein
MRIVTNQELVRRNRRLANILFFFSMGVLIAGFLVANLQLTAQDETSLALSLILPWIVLPIGFIATLASVRMTNLWVRRPRPEEVIPAGLKGISKRSVLYNYYHFPARHVLIAPQGTFAIITRFQEGSYTVEGDQWKTAGGPLAGLVRFLRRDAIGNPTEEARRAALHIKQLLSKDMPDVEVQPLVIFTDPRASLKITNPRVPVLYADENKEPNLRDYMRELAQRQEKVSTVDSKKKATRGKPIEPRPEGGMISPEQVADALEEATIVS